MKKFNELKALVESAEADFTAFYTKGNKAAGTRVRGFMQQAKTIAQDIRTEISEQKSKK